MGLVSDDARRSWETLLGPINRMTAIGGRNALIAEAGPGEFIMHIRAIDQEAVDLLKRRPAGLDTLISLWALHASDDISLLDSHILAVGGAEPLDLTPLRGLSARVERLSIVGALIRERQRLPVDQLRHLRALSADWRALDLSGGFAPALRCLWVDSYHPTSVMDLAVNGCERIESLSIIRGRSLVDLEGLEAFTGLSHLTVYGCPRLADLSPLSKMPALRHVDVEACRKLTTIEGAMPPAIESLAVTDCGTIDSIRGITSFPTLQRVALNGDTVVQDRDLTPLLHLPALESVLLASRRGYNPPSAEVARRFGEWRPVIEPR